MTKTKFGLDSVSNPTGLIPLGAPQFNPVINHYPPPPISADFTRWAFSLPQDIPHFRCQAHFRNPQVIHTFDQLGTNLKGPYSPLRFGNLLRKALYL